MALFRLVLMSYSLMVDQGATCQTLSKVYKDMVEILFVLQISFANDPQIENLLCHAMSWSEACLWVGSVQQALCLGGI
jgi:hypothetical protein